MADGCGGAGPGGVGLGGLGATHPGSSEKSRIWLRSPTALQVSQNACREAVTNVKVLVFQRDSQAVASNS